MKIKIIKAEQKHIKEVGILFDLYRQFYKYESNLIESTNYIKDRINNNESTIFIAISDALMKRLVLFNFMKLSDRLIWEKL